MIHEKRTQQGAGREVSPGPDRAETRWFRGRCTFLKWYEGSFKTLKISISISSVVQSCPTLCDPTNCSTPGFPVLHQLPELTQTHVHRVSDAIQLSHPLLSPSLPAFYLSQHQSLFQWIGSSHQVAKVLELQLQDQFFQWIFRTDFL